MPDMKNLSKLKYIYRVYESSDKVLHIEKYPIIYINSKVVYFKDVRKQEYIHRKDLNQVKDSFVDFYTSSWGDYPCFDRYFWNVETNVYDIYNELKEKHEEFRINEKIKKTKEQMENSKRMYERYLKEYEELKNKLEQEN